MFVVGALMRAALFSSADRSAEPSLPDDVRIRYARPQDDTALARLAALDSTAVPAPPLLVADVGVQVRAALSLVSSKVIADPFNLTAPLVELLRGRAVALAGGAPETAPIRDVAHGPNTRCEELPSDRQRVVVPGGGFGGLPAAFSLARPPVEVPLIDRRSEHRDGTSGCRGASGVVRITRWRPCPHWCSGWNRRAPACVVKL